MRYRPCASGTCLTLVLLSWTFSPASSAQSMSRLAGSVHDFSSPAGGSITSAAAPEFSDLCGRCHITVGFGERPIGRTRRAKPAQPYSIGWGSTSGDEVRLAASSLICLSCHDGTVADEVHAEWDLGTDLTDDHPIGIVYDPLLSSDLRSVSDIADAGLKLHAEGGVNTVECVTCHDPHDPSELGLFTRVPARGAELCQVCHIK